jgi:hypothetical protein
VTDAGMLENFIRKFSLIKSAGHHKIVSRYRIGGRREADPLCPKFSNWALSCAKE